MEINSDAVSRNLRSPAAEAMPAQEAAAPTADAERAQQAPAAQKPAPQTQESAIREVLLASGFKASPENIKLAAALLEGQFPLNRENLQKLTQGMRLLGTDIENGADEAMFFLKNDIPPTSKNVGTLRGFINGNIKIMSQLENLMKAVGELPDAALRENILKALAGETAGGQAAKGGAGAAGEALPQAQGGGQTAGQIAAGGTAQTAGQTSATAAGQGQPTAEASAKPPAAGPPAPQDISAQGGARNTAQQADASATGTAQNARTAEAGATLLDGKLPQTESAAQNTAQTEPAPQNVGADRAAGGQTGQAATAEPAPATAEDIPPEQSLKTAGAASPNAGEEPAAAEKGGAVTAHINEETETAGKAGGKNVPSSDPAQGAAKTAPPEGEEPLGADAARRPDIFKDGKNGLPAKEAFPKPGEPGDGMADMLKSPRQTAEAREKEPLMNLVRQRLQFDPKDTDNKDVDEFLNRLRDGVEAARAELQKSAAPQGERVLRELSNIKESLDFVNHMKENIYLQLPINVGNHRSNGEILVFRDRKARKRPPGESVSAMIALDTLSMGRFEVYVQKTGKNVTCQFRLRDEEVERLTRANVSRLQTMLGAKGFSLSDITYRKAEESFSVLGAPRGGGESGVGGMGKKGIDVST